MKYLDELKQLNLPKSKYAIFGSGPMTIKGIRQSKDIDVVVKGSLYKNLLKKYKEFKPGQIKIVNIEIFASWNTVINNSEKVIDRAEIIKGFKFVRLDDLIKWKQKLGRPKDFKDIQLIKDYLSLNKNRKKYMPWYKDFFEKWYLELYQGIPRFKPSYIKKEVAFIKRVLDLPKGAKILDLCSGHGRHSILLAKVGYHVTAFDLSKKALDILREEAKKQKLDIRTIQGDMRRIPFENEFDAVINMFTSFGYFVNSKENFKVLEGVIKALKPDGKFLIDIRNKKTALNNLPSRNWYKAKDYFVLEEYKFRPKTNQGIVKLIIIDKNGKTYSAGHTTKLYSLIEMKEMLKRAGFSKFIKLYGSTTEIQKFTFKSRRLIILARK